jgi:hypothetical protein
MEKGLVQTEKGLVDGGLILKAVTDAHPGMTTEQAAKALFAESDAGLKISQQAGKGVIGRIRKALGTVHPDAAPGVLATLEGKASKEALEGLMQIGNDAFRATTTTGWQRVTTDAALAMGVDKASVDAGLKSLVREGRGIAPWGTKGSAEARALYEQSKGAAAALGGVRFRASIPIIGARFQTQRIALLPSTLDFSIGRRFFAGLSGQTRLMKMIGHGEATMEDMRAFWEGGYSGLREFNPELANKLGTKGLHGGSIFYPMSEALGGVTKKLSPHAAVVRGGGLGAKYGASASQAATHVQQQIRDDILTTVLPDGTVLTPDQAQEALVKAARVGGKTTDDAAVTQFYDDLTDYGSLVKDPQANAKKYYDDLIIEENMKDRLPGPAKTDPERVAVLRDEQKRAIELEQKVRAYISESGEDPDKVIEIWRSFNKQRQEATYHSGEMPQGTEDVALNRDELTPADAEEWLSHGNDTVKDAVWEAVDPSTIVDNGGHMNSGVLSDTNEAAGTVSRSFSMRQRGKLNATTANSLTPPAPPTHEIHEATDSLRFKMEADRGRVAGLRQRVKENPDNQAAAQALDEAQRNLDGSTAKLDRALQAEREVKAEQKGVVVVQLDEAQRRSMSESPDIVARPLNPYERDLRTTATRPEGEAVKSTEIVDEYSVVEEDVRNFYDAVRAGDPETGVTKLSPDVQERVRAIVEGEESLNEQIAPLVTQQMQSKGYDAVITRTDDGVYMDLFAGSDGSLPAVKVNPFSTRVLTHRGAPARVLTASARDAVGRRSGTVQRLVEKALRDTLHMPRAQAEQRLRDELAKAGVTLRPHQRVLETDPVRVMNETTNQVAKRAKDRYMGRATQVAEHLGFTRGAFQAGAVGVEKFRYIVNESAVLALEKQANDVQESADKGAAISAKELPKYTEQANEVAERVARHEADLLDEQERTFTVIEAHTARDFVLDENGQIVLDAAGNPRVGAAAENPGLSDLADQLDAPNSAAERNFIKGRDSGKYVPMDTVTTSKGRRITIYSDQGDVVAGEHAVYVAVDPDTGKMLGYRRIGDRAPRSGARPQELVDMFRDRFLSAVERAPVSANYELLLARLDDIERLAGFNDLTPDDISFLLTKPITGAEAEALGNPALSGKAMPKSVGDGFEDVQRRLQILQDDEEASVAALTATSAQGQGIGEALLRAHWRALGIKTPKDAIPYIKSQGLSAAGSKLNKRAVENLTQELIRDGRRNMEQELKDLEQELVPTTEALNEAGRLVARNKMRPAPTLAAMAPAENAKNMTGMEVLTGIPGLDDQTMPTFMAQEFRQALTGYRTLDGPHKQWRQFNSLWKEMATWMFPGFHIRNFMGAFFNNFLGGVGMRDYLMTRRIRFAERELFHGDPAARRWVSMKVAAKDPDFIQSLRRNGQTHLYGTKVEDLTYGDMATITAGMGVTASNGRAFAEARLTVEAIEKRHGQRALERAPVVGRAGKLYFEGMRGAGTLTENLFRTAAFVRGVRNSGSLMEARAFTMLRHGDYFDLTDWEYGWIRDLIPFYKWMRTNTPFQIHQLLESPGKLLGVQKLQSAVYTGMGRDYDEDRKKMPEWMQKSFTIPLGKDEAFKAVMLDLPMSDMFTSGREFVSSFLPTVRPFLESYVVNQSVFSGAPLEGKPVELPAFFKPIAPLLTATNMAKVGEDGTVFIDDKLQNVLGAIPVFSRLRNWIYEDPDRVKLRSNTVASSIFGMGLRPVDEETMVSSELDFYYSQVLPTMEHLKDMGYPVPTTDDLQMVVGSTNNALLSLGIQPSADAA